MQCNAFKYIKSPQQGELCRVDALAAVLGSLADQSLGLALAHVAVQELPVALSKTILPLRPAWSVTCHSKSRSLVPLGPAVLLDVPGVQLEFQGVLVVPGQVQVGLGDGQIIAHKDADVTLRH